MTTTPNTFDSNAQKIAQEFVLDVQEVKAAYAGKEDTLSTLFNSMSDAKKNLSLHKATTIVCGIITIPALMGAVVAVVPGALTAYCGLQWRSKNAKIEAVRTAVANQIAVTKGAAAPAPAPAAA